MFDFIQPFAFLKAIHSQSNGLDAFDLGSTVLYLSRLARSHPWWDPWPSGRCAALHP